MSHLLDLFQALLDLFQAQFPKTRTLNPKKKKKKTPPMSNCLIMEVLVQPESPLSTCSELPLPKQTDSQLLCNYTGIKYLFT